MDNLYEILGIEQNANKEDIKKAYKKKALVHHPDRGGDEEEFKKVAKAYEILSDDNKRARYDATGSIEDSPNNQGFNGFDNIYDFFETVFGSKTRKGEDVNIQFNLKLNEFFNGLEREITYNKAVPCHSCDSTGGKVGVCTACKGHGRVNIRQGSMNMVTTCHTCHGHGQIIIEPCVKCDGNAFIMEEVKKNIIIPPCSFKNVVYENEGHGILDGDDGNLIISIKVIDMEGFMSERFDLYKNIEVPYYDLMLGCVLDIKTVEYTTIKMTVPKNTQPNAKLKVKGKGLKIDNGENRGDMIITVIPIFPDMITDEEEKLLKELKKNRE